jgi:hypothetical protein
MCRRNNSKFVEKKMGRRRVKRGEEGLEEL